MYIVILKQLNVFQVPTCTEPLKLSKYPWVTDLKLRHSKNMQVNFESNAQSHELILSYILYISKRS